MTFLAKAQKVDLLSLAAEVGLDLSPNVGSLELIKLIQSSADYEQKIFKDLLKAVTSARMKKEEEQKEKAGKEKEKEREHKLLLKKMELETEERRIELTTGERVFDPEVGMGGGALAYT
ncbi:hypothetical protein AVEN_93406-1 [Araneus ventricosus]|uniref:Uncharacterized protein n=1 Tax=Araneus ventricosus TaxID=182803 RepID=A0A4Y2APE5_ARAVE|nr:hypothetical protein AVEN_93406-1 [Araneus ventricosus]